jgi:hypothetical protein
VTQPTNQSDSERAEREFLEGLRYEDKFPDEPVTQPKEMGSIRRIIVCGGRKYRDSGRVYMVLEEYVGLNPTIVHGDYSGADRLADREACELGLAVEPHPADWSQGRKAGPLRNQEMIAAGADLVIAFAGGDGTADCVRRARKAGIPVREEP